MNTLGDTDEGRARPSVWPVYVAAGMVGVDGLLFLFFGIWGGLANQDNDVEALAFGVLFGLTGALGVAAAWGLFRLRPWAWWWGVASSSVVVGSCLLALLGLVVPWHTRLDEVASGLSFWLILAVPLVLLWILVTHQHLFFPPKPEGEE